jgi:hypothetical protein
VRQQGVAAVQDVRDGVYLVRLERDLRVDAGELQMAPVVLTRADAVEFFVIKPDQPFAPVMIFP